jgi:cytochrome c peroxidase
MFKPPILRDLAVRAPFFHAGAAQDMQHLVNFYNLRFGFGLTAAEQADLVNFLNALYQSLRSFQPARWKRTGWPTSLLIFSSQ